MRPSLPPLLLAATFLTAFTAASGAGALVHDRLPEPVPPAATALPWGAGTLPLPPVPDPRAAPVDAEGRESGGAEPGL